MSTVFVVGAGPAGLFAAQKIALAGHEVIIFNRDIKPGGLAEYGIYPTKDKMKNGLRKQFDKVLSLPNVHYFGNVPVRSDAPVSIEVLREFSPAALVFAVGAQGTKKLGLPGEEAAGIYCAKDFVYFYNQLPPFASQDFSTGKRVAIVGMGNVMVDIAHWLLKDDPARKTEEVIVVARRGPFEAKFDRKEFAYVEMHLDRQAIAQELERVKERVVAVGQDISQVPEKIFPVLTKPGESIPPRLKFRFLCSPKAIRVGPDGRIAGLTVTENLLVPRNGGTAPKATDQTAELDVDTMIFAIGDVADPRVGLPYAGDGYVTSPNSDRPDAPYQVFDAQGGEVMEGVFVVGWSRRASEGLVGIARHDGEVGAGHVLKYLESAAPRRSASVPEMVKKLESRGVRLVKKSDLPFLQQAEQNEAKGRGKAWFKFSDDAEMLAAIEREKAKSMVSV